jgi:hypothetical protein
MHWPLIRRALLTVAECMHLPRHPCTRVTVARVPRVWSYRSAARRCASGARRKDRTRERTHAMDAAPLTSGARASARPCSVSLEELRIEAQRVVRLERLMGGHGGGGGDESGEGGEGGGGAAGGGGGGTAGGGASEGGGRARKSRDDMKSVDARDEKEVNTMARVRGHGSHTVHAPSTDRPTAHTQCHDCT